MTDLKPVGSTQVDPETLFFWNNDNQATVEITVLEEDFYLVRTSKSYILRKQDKEGQETWDRNLRKLNKYLSETFHSFQISVNYSNEISKEVTSSFETAKEAAAHTEQLKREKQKLVEKIKSLESSKSHGFDDLEPVLEDKLADHYSRLDSVESNLENLLEVLQKKKTEIGEWQDNGVISSYFFTFSTEPEITRQENLNQIIDNHLEQVFNYHQHSVKQTLTRRSGNFKLVVDELETPRMFKRLQHTSLLNPASFQQLENQNPEISDELNQLRKDQLKQYQAYAVEDLAVNDEVFERSKATPAQAVNSLLQDLESEKVADTSNLPNNGPILGTATGTELPAGIDPSNIPHYYICGSTGSGKSYTKRILMENCLSLGYNTISITPRDLESLAAALPYKDNENGRGLAGDYYWPEHDSLPNLPEQTAELFNGAKFITLRNTLKPDKDQFITRLFTEVADQGQLDKPLFIFLDEAHLFAQGDPAEAIQKAVRQTRKFGVHVVLITQSPMDFNYNYKHIRENTQGNFFLQGEYFDYADQLLDDSSVITDLEQGNAIFQGRGQPQIEIDMRKPLSQVEQLGEKQVEEVEKLVSASAPDPATWKAEEHTATDDPSDDAVYSHDPASSSGGGSGGGAEADPVLGEDEEEVVQGIRAYVSDEDQLPSKNKTIDYSPFGTSKTSRLLDELEEKGVVETSTETRYGNEATVYQIH